MTCNRDHSGESKSERETSDEPALVARARGGDQEAFAELVRRHQDAIHGLVHRLTGGRDAEDVTQDVFIRAWRSLERFRGEARFSTWLYRIAVNLCHDHRAHGQSRLRGREVSLDGPERGPSEPLSPDPGPDQVYEAGRMSRAFQEALEDLEAPYRMAFLLRHQEGLSPREIAQVLGISESNAKVRVHRAREAVMAALRKRGHDV